MPYKYLFFDLDKTIYDFDASTRITFEEIYRDFGLKQSGVHSLEGFMEIYNRINLELWDRYRAGDMTKETLRVERFRMALEAHGINNPKLAEKIGNYYVTESPLKNTLFPGVEETLSQLQKRYHLFIITNGFEEVQHKKLNINKLRPFFTHMITSEEAGCRKPDPGIFVFAMEKAHASPEESLMIGDDLEVDIRGARAAGMDQVYINYEQAPHADPVTYEVHRFPELLDFL